MLDPALREDTTTPSFPRARPANAYTRLRRCNRGQAGATDSGNKIAASAHGMGSGGLAVDAMAIGCLGVERRVDLGLRSGFFHTQPFPQFGTMNFFTGT
jgi:hypothetical protein